MSTVVVLLVIAALLVAAKWREKRMSPAKPPADYLDTPLMYWSPHDPFTIRDLLRSISIMGATGSGKTSGIGYQLGKALAACPRIGGIIIASKPEDRAVWQGILGDRLIVVGPGEKHRFNVIDFEAKHGADAREITQCIMTISEALTRSEGQTGDRFFEKQDRRTIHNACEVLIQAYGRVDAWDVQRFINDAPLSIEELGQEKWREGFHNKTMEKAGNKAKSQIEAHDFELAWQFWGSEWPALNDRTRSSILAGVMGQLHVFNTGIVRELIGTGTTISPEVFECGAWILVDMPIANYGVAGAFVAGAWKYATQRHVLRRAATAETPVTCIWIDEFQNYITSYDAKVLAECRSHLACMVVLTQSIHSFYSSIGGREAQSHTKALLTNFGTKVAMTLGNEESAKYFSSLIGRAIIRLGGSSSSGGGQVFEEFMGKYNLGTSLNEHIEDLILPRLFMNGLRTGGPENGYIAEGWVIRNGTAFSNGENAMLVGFSQR